MKLKKLIVAATLTLTSLGSSLAADENNQEQYTGNSKSNSHNSDRELDQNQQKQPIEHTKNYPNLNNATVEQNENIYFGLVAPKIYGGYQYDPNISIGGKFINFGNFSALLSEVTYHRNYINKNLVPYVSSGVGIGSYKNESKFLIKIGWGLEINFNDNFGFIIGADFIDMNLLDRQDSIGHIGLNFRF